MDDLNDLIFWCSRFYCCFVSLADANYL